MFRRRPVSRAIAVISLIVLLAACGSGTSAILSKVGASVGGEGSRGDSGASAAPAPAVGVPGDNQDDLNAPLRDDAKIVRNGSLSLQVTNIAAALSGARDAVRSVGGYVAGSQQKNDGDSSVAEVTYRIPSDRWDDALDAIRKQGKLLGEQTSSVEVTGQLVDLEARIANLRASEKALQAIAQRATKISDILEVENQLSNVRGQIEQLDGQRSRLSDQASYGTLSVTYGIEILAVNEATKGWNAGQEVDHATASLVNVLQAVTSAGIWFAIVWLPILLGIGLIVAGAAFVLRRTGVLRRTEPVAPAPVE